MLAPLFCKTFGTLCPDVLARYMRLGRPSENLSNGDCLTPSQLWNWNRHWGPFTEWRGQKPLWNKKSWHLNEIRRRITQSRDVQYLRLHTMRDTFLNTVQKARRFAAAIEGPKSRKSVRITTPPAHEALQMIVDDSSFHKRMDKLEDMIRSLQYPSVKCVTGRQPQHSSWPLVPRGSTEQKPATRTKQKEQ